MSDIRRLFRELNFEIIKIVLLDSFMTSAVVFLILQIILSFLGVSWYFPAGLSFSVMIILFILHVRKIKLVHIEEKNPELKEILRTAKDNEDWDENPMLQAMNRDLMSMMKNMSMGSLIDNRRLIIKVVMVSFLCVVLVISAVSSTRSINLSKIIQDRISSLDIDFTRKSTPQFGKPKDREYQPRFNTTEDLYGNSSVAQIGDDEILLEIKPSENLKDSVDPTKQDEYSKLYPDQIGAVSSEAYSEDDIEDFQLVLEYNLRIQDLNST